MRAGITLMSLLRIGLYRKFIEALKFDFTIRKAFYYEKNSPSGVFIVSGKKFREAIWTFSSIFLVNLSILRKLVTMLGCTTLPSFNSISSFLLPCTVKLKSYYFLEATYTEKLSVFKKWGFSIQLILKDYFLWFITYYWCLMALSKYFRISPTLKHISSATIFTNAYVFSVA